MIRKDRETTRAQAEDILKRGDWGVLSTAGADGLPYGVPLNYVYVPEENAIYFHCARKGKKLDDMRSDSRVCFTVVTRSEIDAGRFTTRYESAIVRGTASLTEDEGEKMNALVKLCEALTPGEMEGGLLEIKRGFKAVGIVKIRIDSITGKRNS